MVDVRRRLRVNESFVRRLGCRFVGDILGNKVKTISAKLLDVKTKEARFTRLFINLAWIVYSGLTSTNTARTTRRKR